MKTFKRITALVMAVILSLSLVGCSSGIEADETNAELVQAINNTSEYILKEVTAPTYGDETAIIALNRSTYIDYWHSLTTNYVNKLDHLIKTNGYVLGDGSKKIVYAEGYPDAILAMTTAGIYANWANSGDLLKGISYDNVVMMGGYLNKVDALTALESGKYTPSEGGDLTRRDLIDFTMELQKADGSFSYANMGEVSEIEVTASAVTGLILTGEGDEVADAAASGVGYLKANISEDAAPMDIIKTVIALNTAGVDATDVDGKDLISWVMKYARDNGSFSFDETAKKGNKDDASWALLALASQYRFQQGMTSVYDLSDVLGGTHNQLSPEWMLYVKFMISFMIFMGVVMVSMLILSRVRIYKWKKEGIYDYEHNCRMSDEEIAAVMERRAREAQEAAAVRTEKTEE
ncbi:MAG: hypothetical protein IKY90_06480 [Oscillospiraceae bacterium]|nr:hypothetical protein [Oscillospiraceae bacterium]